MKNKYKLFLYYNTEHLMGPSYQNYPLINYWKTTIDKLKVENSKIGNLLFPLQFLSSCFCHPFRCYYEFGLVCKNSEEQLVAVRWPHLLNHNVVAQITIQT